MDVDAGDIGLLDISPTTCSQKRGTIMYYTNQLLPLLTHEQLLGWLFSEHKK